MAINLREASLPVQLLLGVALAVVIVAIGLYLPMSPVQTVKADLAAAQSEHNSLEGEVSKLRQVKSRHADLKAGIAAREKQLAALKEIVPEEKELDVFILMVNREAATSSVAIRRLTAKPIVQRDYHMEMPFEFEVDGPYYNVLDFFSRLSRLSRIINVGDLALSGLGEAKRPRFPTGPGTTVTGTFTATTFFTKGAEGPPAQPAKKAGGKTPAKQPAKR
jgi:type IV pilus assembly protein PilO